MPAFGIPWVFGGSKSGLDGLVKVRIDPLRDVIATVSARFGAGKRLSGNSEGAVVAGREPAVESCRSEHRSGGLRRVRRYLRNRSGVAPVEAILAIGILLVGVGGIVEIVRSAYKAAEYGGAARAAAHRLAMAPHVWGTPEMERAIACAEIKAQLDLDVTFECGSTWTFTVTTGLTPINLLEGTGPEPGELHADMVLVEIAWTRLPWSWNISDLEDVEEVSMKALGVARGEPGG